MSLMLHKGQRLDLSKSNPSLKRVRIALTWGSNTSDTGADYDLDATAFGINNSRNPKTPKCVSEKYVIFYNQLESPCKSIKHSGDNLVGGAAGDDEVITIDLPRVPTQDPLNIDEISIIVTIHEALQRKQNFGQIPGSAIRLYDDETDKLLCEYSLDYDFTNEVSVQFGSLIYRNNSWSFHAVGKGFNRGLAEFIQGYGLNI